jgi:L-threonylcarbamoyladenylate synthase
MAAKHYAPRTRVLIAARGGDGVAAAVAQEGAIRLAAIVATEEASRAASGCTPLVVLPDAPEGYARGLFAALHAVDEAGVDAVVIEEVPAGAAWWAIADRLARAARR